MPEIKNSFTSSKMNQDLDDRLIPQNEYREGRNISIISSDSSNTGSIENILGNRQMASLGSIQNGEVIGFVADKQTNSLYVMLTNYTDNSITKLDSNPQFTSGNSTLRNKILKVELSTGSVYTLVDGLFLNLSKTHPITGINLLEDLLFWTDNRNQPRKINVKTALNIPGYYTNEDQISVAKYAPVSSIKFIDSGICTMKDVVSHYLPDGTTVNPYYNANYPGDPNYLQDKFVRFSYRFRFDDGEYSIYAPFSQIAFIPQQDGSFLNGDENNSYTSTIVTFMKNKVNQINLIIPIPTTCDKLFSEFKITEIDILYKESDSLNVQVLDIINKESLSLVTTPYYNYTYQSRKPKTTLQQDQLIRVYDKVPVRALAQETAGGRIIYGNYIDKHTPPNSIDYKVGISGKIGDTKIQYPLHTVKQNRNYQVGIILSDRFGRQSDVILSPIKNDGSTVPDSGFFGGSSFYTPYLPTGTDVLSFVGNSIKILFNDYIYSTKSQLNDLGIPATGEPGLYDYGGKVLSYIFTGTGIDTLGSGLTDGTYANVPALYTNGLSTGVLFTVVVSGGSMSLSGTIITNGSKGINSGTHLKLNIPLQPLGSVLPIVSALDVTQPNTTGWYSYKVVIKQNQQEYYNVYVPGVLSGYPTSTTTTFPTGEETKTSNVILFSDNINKVPRDLSEVGPDQKQYRSSVVLFGRVQNNGTILTPGNAQFFPLVKGFSITTLANSEDLKITPSTITLPTNLYQLNTNPIIGRISTNGSGSFGTTATNFAPYLSVLETNPFVSELDIYWETSTTGLISDLNTLIASEKPGAYAFINVNYKQNENQNPTPIVDSGITGSYDSKYVTDSFYAVDYLSNRLDTATASILSVVDANGNDLLLPTNRFALESTTISGKNSYRIKITDNFYYNRSINLNKFTFTLLVNDLVSSTINQVTILGSVNNEVPSIDNFTLGNIISGQVDIYTFSGVNGSFGNTSISTKTSDLKWTFSNGTQTYLGGGTISPFTLTLNPDSGFLSVTSGIAKTLENPTIVLTDSGNAIDTAQLTLDFTPGEFNPIEFNLDFNL